MQSLRSRAATAATDMVTAGSPTCASQAAMVCCCPMYPPGFGRMHAFDQDGSKLGPLKARLLPMDAFKKLRRVYYVNGDSYMTNCWRQPRFKRNPAHFLIGAGKIFSAAQDPTVGRNLTSIIWHQCPTREGWRWASNVWSVVEDAAHDSRLWTSRHINEIVLAPRWKSKEPF